MNDNPCKQLLIEFANALESAGALARKIADSELFEIRLTVDGETAHQVVYKAMRDNPEASEPLRADSERKSP